MGENGGYVLLPQPVEEEAVELLEKRGMKVIQAADTRFETVAPLMEKARAVVLRTGIRMTKELMGKASDLLMISRTGAGFDNIDIQYATEQGILVTSSLGINTSSVVEHCLALMVSLFKQLFLMDREVRKGNFAVRYRNYPRDLKNKCLGVIGFGRIGSRLAEQCHKLFHMKIVAHDPYITDTLKKQYSHWVNFTTLEDVFENADVVSVHIPLTEVSKGLINMKYFRLMKPDAFIINAARGGIVNEVDLVEALSRDIIAGAGIDVFDTEPVKKNNPLLGMDNAILTPHSAALTKECVIEMAVSAVQRVIDLFDGYIPENVANPELLMMGKWKYLKEKG